MIGMLLKYEKYYFDIVMKTLCKEEYAWKYVYREPSFGERR